MYERMDFADERRGKINKHKKNRFLKKGERTKRL